jgi:undecaprenyl-diphosphatase
MTGPHTGPARSIALAFDWYGRSASWIDLLVIGLILVLIRRPWSALFVITGRAVAALTSTAIKALTERERPPGQLVAAGGSSFPSGHVCAVAATVVLVAALLTGTARKVWWVFAFIVTIAMAWSRTYLHEHWLTDALAGAALGAAVGFAWWWLFEPRLRSERTLSEIPLPPPRSPD